ncbi:MAG: anthranilate synthase component I family protein, partial [candidate division Zixibacteria bacterium]|nr:anthranilate synthase component I family protein [candidate division Zixibacteria bacterium]
LGLENRKKSIIPDIQFLIYDVVLIYDHITKELVSSNPNIDNFTDLLESTDISTDNISLNKNKIKTTYTKDEYLRKIKKVKHHIKEGDIYQANFTCGFEVESKQNPFHVYSKLRNFNPAPYSAFLNFGDFQILSSSMERMFKKENNILSTCPIKGTIQRGASITEGKTHLDTLLNSEKDKAELLMIIDLERNDLGKVAQTGTVKVNELFKPEIYSSVIHLVSEITCQTDNNIKISDIINAMLPGGSITGAPKKRAVEILLELEKIRRNVYTGCIGYVWGKQADFNIAIRTILHKDSKYYLHAGGGIVADSDPENEYNEMLLKAKNLFRAIGVE